MPLYYSTQFYECLFCFHYYSLNNLLCNNKPTLIMATILWIFYPFEHCLLHIACCLIFNVIHALMYTAHFKYTVCNVLVDRKSTVSLRKCNPMIKCNKLVSSLSTSPCICGFPRCGNKFSSCQLSHHTPNVIMISFY